MTHGRRRARGGGSARGAARSSATALNVTFGSVQQTGGRLPSAAVSRIETNALVRGGMAQDMAAATVTRAIHALKEAAVSGPTRIPREP